MWDIKYRPKLFSDVLGQEGAVQVLKARIKNGSVLNTSYIFAGGPGQGKTTLARILARAALCPNVSKETGEPCNTCDQCLLILGDIDSAFEERDAGSGGGIDVVREMLKNLSFAPPNDAPIRVWLFDEAHRMSTASQDALLKPIEEKQVVCIFCTTEGRKIVGPVYRRCEEHPIHRVTRDQILSRMRMVLASEKVDYEEEAVLIVIDHCGGHVRDVLNRLESLSQLGPITVASVKDNLKLGFISMFYEILLSLGDPARTVRLVEDLCESMAPEDISAGLSEAAMNSFRICNSMPAEFTFVDKVRAQQVYQRFGPGTLKVAEFFLRTRFVTKVSLICDVITLVQNGVLADPSAVQPVMFSIPAPVPQAAQAPVRVEPSVEGEVLVTPVTPAPVELTSSPPPAPVLAPIVLAPPTQVRTGNGTLRSDGVGSVGSGDRLALTSLDHNGVPREHPRKMSTPTPKLDLNFNLHREEDILTPADWKREFETLRSNG